MEQLASEVLSRRRDGVRASDLGTCLIFAGGVLLRSGDREGAEAVWREVGELAEHTGDMTLAVRAMGLPPYLTFIHGSIENALSLCALVKDRAQELRITPGLDATQLLFLLGRGNEQVLEDFQSPRRPVQGGKALVLAYLGRHEEAHKIRQQFGDIGSEEDETASTILLALFETAILGADEETVLALSPRFAPLADQLMLGPAVGFGGSVARLLGDASSLLSKPDPARAYYHHALDVCAKVRFRPEIAIIRLHLAELLLEHYPAELPGAQEHLDFAIGEFRHMKMQPALERALSHKGLLKA